MVIKLSYERNPRRYMILDEKSCVIVMVWLHMNQTRVTRMSSLEMLYLVSIFH